MKQKQSSRSTLKFSKLDLGEKTLHNLIIPIMWLTVQYATAISY